ncbi:MAG: glutaredoxin [Chlorobi bacterium]|nr:glutaredoxin [Chlorobiota bacterium]
MKQIKIEAFSSPGCSKCKRAKDILRKTVAEMESNFIEWREVDILEELDYSVELGVLSTPAIAVNGKLVFTGLPSAAKLRDFLNRIILESVEE